MASKADGLLVIDDAGGAAAGTVGGAEAAGLGAEAAGGGTTVAVGAIVGVCDRRTAARAGFKAARLPAAEGAGTGIPAATGGTAGGGIIGVAMGDCGVLVCDGVGVADFRVAPASKAARAPCPNKESSDRAPPAPGAAPGPGTAMAEAGRPTPGT